jgi:hypothetical protein
MNDLLGLWWVITNKSWHKLITQFNDLFSLSHAQLNGKSFRIKHDESYKVQGFNKQINYFKYINGCLGIIEDIFLLYIIIKKKYQISLKLKTNGKMLNFLCIILQKHRIYDKNDDYNILNMHRSQICEELFVKQRTYIPITM